MPETNPKSAAPRRFYERVDIGPSEQGFVVRLDGRTPRSPRGRALAAPTGDLAELLAAEWRAQGDTINMASMPATRLAHTALDAIPDQRHPTIRSIVDFAGSDLTCYLAEAPGSLVRRQKAAWGPLLDWVRNRHGLVLETRVGVIHRPQPASTLESLDGKLQGESDFGLAGLAFASSLFSSAVIALALRDAHLDAEAAFAASRVDETFQAEAWGVDSEAQARAEGLAREARMVGAWFAALRSGG